MVLRKQAPLSLRRPVRSARGKVVHLLPCGVAPSHFEFSQKGLQILGKNVRHKYIARVTFVWLCRVRRETNCETNRKVL